MRGGPWVAVGAAVVVVGVGVGVGVAATSSSGSKGLGVVRSTDSTVLATPSTVANGGGGSGGGTCNQPSGGSDVASVPANDQAAIFDNFGQNLDDTNLLNEIDQTLSDEGYKLDRFLNPSEGHTGAGSATLDNFVGMAKDCVIVFDTHGFAPSLTTTENTEKTAHGAKSIVTKGNQVYVQVGSTLIQLAGTQSEALLVEWLPTRQQADQRYIDYVSSGRYTNQQIAETCNSYTISETAPCEWWGIVLTSQGIHDFFGHAHVALIDAIACDSLSFQNYFQASAYFGYDHVCFSDRNNHEATDDSRNLFDALAGRRGIDKRTTDGASTIVNGNNFTLAPGSDSIVLSPAVESIDPPDGSVLKPGQVTHVKVKFDAQLDTAGHTPKDAFDLDTNCGESKNEDWTDDSTLEFDIDVPAHPPGTKTQLTLASNEIVGNAGFDNPLDGNQKPAGTDGEAPNGDAYIVHYTCEAPGNLHVEGTINGMPVEGDVDTSSSLQCIPVYTGGKQRGVNVHWSGFTTDTKTSVGGEFDVSFGSWNLADPHTQGQSTFEEVNPKYTQVGASSGTITSSASGGSVDAQYTNGPGSIHVSGSWTCPAGGNSGG